jgi:hypothetical protein
VDVGRRIHARRRGKQKLRIKHSAKDKMEGEKQTQDKT